MMMQANCVLSCSCKFTGQYYLHIACTYMPGHTEFPICMHDCVSCKFCTDYLIITTAYCCVFLSRLFQHRRIFSQYASRLSKEWSILLSNSSFTEILQQGTACMYFQYVLVHKKLTVKVLHMRVKSSGVHAHRFWTVYPES